MRALCVLQVKSSTTKSHAKRAVGPGYPLPARSTTRTHSGPVGGRTVRTGGTDAWARRSRQRQYVHSLVSATRATARIQSVLD